MQKCATFSEQISAIITDEPVPTPKAFLDMLKTAGKVHMTLLTNDPTPPHIPDQTVSSGNYTKGDDHVFPHTIIFPSPPMGKFTVDGMAIGEIGISFNTMDAPIQDLAKKFMEAGVSAEEVGENFKEVMFAKEIELGWLAYKKEHSEVPITANEKKKAAKFYAEKVAGQKVAPKSEALKSHATQYYYEPTTQAITTGSSGTITVTGDVYGRLYTHQQEALRKTKFPTPNIEVKTGEAVMLKYRRIATKDNKFIVPEYDRKSLKLGNELDELVQEGALKMLEKELYLPKIGACCAVYEIMFD